MKPAPYPRDDQADDVEEAGEGYPQHNPPPPPPPPPPQEDLYGSYTLPANETWTLYPPSLLCDANADSVDYNDFVEFSSCFMAGFSPGCEMMDFDGDSNVHADDLDDCFVTSQSDCNANGTGDVADIMLDLGLDADQGFVIDCCWSATPDDPNPIGNTLLLDKDGSQNPVLSWTAPFVDGTHGAATLYDVFRADLVLNVFGFLTNVLAATHTDSISPDQAFYVVGARNGCGSSGEEPF